MIYVCNFKDPKIRQSIWDTKYAIVRSYKNTSTAFIQLSILSPSTELFYRYRQLKAQNNWNERTFQEEYVPAFLKQMCGKEERNALNTIYKESKTKNIIAACFCDEEYLCHRSVVIGLLQGAGANIKTQENKDYSHYYRAYKAL